MTLTFEQWLNMGIEQNFCSTVYCQNHDLHAHKDAEEFAEHYENYEQNMDFCWAIVHIYEGVNG